MGVRAHRWTTCCAPGSSCWQKWPGFANSLSRRLRTTRREWSFRKEPGPINVRLEWGQAAKLKGDFKLQIYWFEGQTTFGQDL